MRPISAYTRSRVRTKIAEQASGRVPTGEQSRHRPRRSSPDRASRSGTAHGRAVARAPAGAFRCSPMGRFA